MTKNVCYNEKQIRISPAHRGGSLKSMKASRISWRPLLCGLLIGCLCALLAPAALAQGAAAESAATPESAAAYTVDELVQQGTGMDAMSDDEMKALLDKAAAASAAATGEDAERLENLQAALRAVLDGRAAGGKRTGARQQDVPNSWRYQNGALVEMPEGNVDEAALATANAAVSDETHWGIDVSAHQNTVDWAAVKAAGVSFAIIRCGYGDDLYEQDDSQFWNNVRGCEAQGIPYGLYLYSYALGIDGEASARSEAAHALRLARQCSPSLPIFLDMEDAKTLGTLNTDQLAQIAQVFCDTVQSAGYPVGIYASRNWWLNRLTADNFSNSSWYVWIARYNSAGPDFSRRYNMWQYGGAYVNGVEGAVDANYWYGSLSTSGGAAPAPTLPPVDPTAAANFVTQLYKVCLGRTPDATGLANWTASLVNHKSSGTDAAAGFIFSDEFKAQNYCNEDYVRQLYKAILGRAEDAPGMTSWVTRLETGTTREEVFNGFAQSGEFKAFCETYGITLGSPITVPVYGTVPTGPCRVCGKTDGVTDFVTRMYKVALNRTPDATGLADWTNRLWTHTASGRDVALGFIFSNEFTSKNYSNTAYVEQLYRAFLDRSADSTGMANWLSRLSGGQTRAQVFDGFVGSDEFTRICQGYGIVRG